MVGWFLPLVRNPPVNLPHVLGTKKNHASSCCLYKYSISFYQLILRCYNLFQTCFTKIWNKSAIWVSTITGQLLWNRYLFEYVNLNNFLFKIWCVTNASLNWYSNTEHCINICYIALLSTKTLVCLAKISIEWAG